jgi:hypothetical protein
LPFFLIEKEKTYEEMKGTLKQNHLAETWKLKDKKYEGV